MTPTQQHRNRVAPIHIAPVARCPRPGAFLVGDDAGALAWRSLPRWCVHFGRSDENGRVLSSLIAAVLTLAVLTALPGPDVAVVTRVALAEGRQAALRAAVGVVSGLLMWGLLTVAGLAGLLAASATAYGLLKIAGAVYLVGLGLMTLWRGRHQTSQVEGSCMPRGPHHPWRVGFTCNILNPKIAVFYTSLLPQLVPAQAPHAVTLSALVLVHVVLSLALLSTYAAIVTRTGAMLTRSRVRWNLDRLTGVALIGLGVRVAAR